MNSKSHQLIRRMIDMGYSDEAIVTRLLHSIEIVQAVRKEIELEKLPKHHNHTEEDWGEE